MEKKIIDTGVNGTFEGTIKITLNYKTKSIDYNNPSTHDVDTRNVFVSKVETIIGGRITSKIDDIIEEEKLEKIVNKLEDELITLIHHMAHTIPKKSFTERMLAKGYQNQKPDTSKFTINFSLVPTDKTYCNNEVYNQLKKIPKTHVDMVKGMIFVSCSDESNKIEVQQYLDENKNLFQYAV